VELPQPFPLLIALSPALVAIAVALLGRRVTPALIAGILTGAAVAHVDDILTGQFLPVVDAVVQFAGEAIIPGIASFEVALGDRANLFGFLSGDVTALDLSHLIISAFSLAIAAMVGVLGRSGATRALVLRVEGIARNARGAQIASWLAGLLVFFDDYANCLVVGSAMGPVCDRFQVSRAKLAFIIDCTAAPIASLALVSTWAGYEIGLISGELDKVGSDLSALTLFIQALPYAFYAISTLTFVGAVAILGRDFGPMLAEERAARQRPSRDEPSPPLRPFHAMSAVIPISLLVILALSFIWIDGAARLAARGGVANATWLDVISAANPFLALLSASCVALLVASVLAVVTGGLELSRLPAAMWAGIKPILPAITVLFLAWALGNALQATRAAQELTDLVRPSNTFVVQERPITIPMTLVGEAKELHVRLLDELGREVHVHRAGPVESGAYSFSWDGLDPNGEEVASVRAIATASHERGTQVEAIVEGHGRFPSWLLPALVFLVAAGTAFATGTSFGTLAILVPLVVPLGLAVSGGEPNALLLGSLAAVLSGAIFGDHASPISDTTVLSSMGAGVDLMTHVRTQLPYALVSGAIALFFGYIPAGLGVSPWILLPVAVGATIGAVRLLGKRVVEPGEAVATA
jgi:Na+/H+ antiporter NhaC